MLATWQAFRTPSRNGVFLMDKWEEDFNLIANKVKPFSDLTIFCNWEDSGVNVASLFDQIKAMAFGSIVCTTKTLHCLAPDLFLILDNAQVYKPWRNYMLNRQILPGTIYDVTGNNYELFMRTVRSRLSSFIQGNTPFLLAAKSISVSNAEQVRYISPIRPNNLPPDLPNTLCKSLDNVLGDRSYDP
jgi:hypothetical protein